MNTAVFSFIKDITRKHMSNTPVVFVHCLSMDLGIRRDELLLQLATLQVEGLIRFNDPYNMSLVLTDKGMAEC